MFFIWPKFNSNFTKNIKKTIIFIISNQYFKSFKNLNFLVILFRSNISLHLFPFNFCTFFITKYEVTATSSTFSPSQTFSLEFVDFQSNFLHALNFTVCFVCFQLNILWSLKLVVEIRFSFFNYLCLIV